MRISELRSKIGCISEAKINRDLFCVSLDLHYLCSRKRINNDEYGRKDNDNDRSEEADFENSKVGTGPQVVH